MRPGTRAEPGVGACVLVLGAGDLGARAASFLARSGALGRLVVTRRSADDACRLANSLLLHADLLGHRLETAGVGLDVTEVEATAELLQDLRPDLVLSCAIVERWWLGDDLPPQRRRHFYGLPASMRKAASRQLVPTSQPSARAVALTRLIRPRASMSSASPIFAESWATVAPAMPRSSR